MGKWKRSELSPALCTIIAGSTPPTSDERYWNGDNIWITPNDLSSLNGHIISDSERKLSDLGVKRANGKALPAQSVVISCRAPVGYCAVASVPFTTNQGCKSLTCHGINETYLYYYLSRSTALLERVSSGTTFLELPKKELARFQVDYPESTTEQRKIVEVLTTVDEAIDDTRALIEKYTNIKAGMLQDLLGSGKPVRLGDVVEGFQYGLNAAAKPYDGENKYIRITDIDDQSHRFLEDDLSSPSGFLTDEYLLQEGDIVFARTGASTGKTYLYTSGDGKVYFAGFLVRARVKGGYDARFVFYQTQSDRYLTWVQIMSLRSGQPGINAKEYAQYTFCCPSKPEQTRIADMLTAADEKIESERNYLEKLQNIKRGLMQDLLDPDGVSVDALI